MAHAAGWKHSAETRQKMSDAQKRRVAEGRHTNFYQTDEGKRRAKAARDAIREEIKANAPICWVTECGLTVTLGRYGWAGPTSEFCKNHSGMNNRAERYGTDLKAVMAQYVAQGKKCCTCSTSLEFNCSDRAQSVHIDHDHATGKFRGLLCRRCNSVLGYINDDPTLLQAMVKYLIE